MKKYELTSVSSPMVEFECNGHLCVSEAIKNTKKNPNFSNPILPRMIVVSKTCSSVDLVNHSGSILHGRFKG